MSGPLDPEPTNDYNRRRRKCKARSPRPAGGAASVPAPQAPPPGTRQPAIPPSQDTRAHGSQKDKKPAEAIAELPPASLLACSAPSRQGNQEAGSIRVAQVLVLVVILVVVVLVVVLVEVLFIEVLVLVLVEVLVEIFLILVDVLFIEVLVVVEVLLELLVVFVVEVILLVVVEVVVLLFVFSVFVFVFEVFVLVGGVGGPLVQGGARCQPWRHPLFLQPGGNQHLSSEHR